MGTVEINNPLAYVTKDIGNDGRVYLGKQYADTKVRIVVEAVEDASACSGEE